MRGLHWITFPFILVAFGAAPALYVQGEHAKAWGCLVAIAIFLQIAKWLKALSEK